MAQPLTRSDTLERPTLDRAPLQRRSARRIALRLLVDGMAVLSALFISSIIRFEIMSTAPEKNLDYTVITLLVTPAWIILFWLYGLYEPRQVLSPVNEFKQVFHGVVAGTVLIFLADSAFNLELARGWALLALVSGFVVVGAERLLVRKML